MLVPAQKILLRLLSAATLNLFICLNSIINYLGKGSQVYLCMFIYKINLSPPCTGQERGTKQHVGRKGSMAGQ